jgi:hypothetical protein
MHTIEINKGHYLRHEAENFALSVYKSSYGATIKNFPTTLIVHFDKSGKFHAVAGFRDSSDGYFSEYYLDEAIEAVIGAVMRKRVSRDKIVEVSCLASRAPAISIKFMRELVRYGTELGFEWAFFTATARLEKLLLRMRLPLITLGKASATRVPNPEIWGTYYDTDPRVLAFSHAQLLPFFVEQDARMSAFEVRAHG